MTDEKRPRRALPIVVSGGRRTGKTTAIRKLVEAARKGGERVWVLIPNGIEIATGVVFPTPDLAKLLKATPHVEKWRFAFDHPSSEPTVVRAIELLQKAGINRADGYVLVGFRTTHREDLARLALLRRLNQRAYVMVYRTKERPDDPRLPLLQQYANSFRNFTRYDFETFLREVCPGHSPRLLAAYLTQRSRKKAKA